MKFQRRQFLHLAAGAAALPAASRIARAQAYPTRPVHYPARAELGLHRRLVTSVSAVLGDPGLVASPGCIKS